MFDNEETVKWDPYRSICSTFLSILLASRSQSLDIQTNILAEIELSWGLYT